MIPGALTVVSCSLCGCGLRDGDSALASDWTVLDVSGQRAAWRLETRYTCDDCAEVTP